jgi:hypothetical protein
LEESGNGSDLNFRVHPLATVRNNNFQHLGRFPRPLINNKDNIMQSMFSFITDKAQAVAKYEPQNVNKQGDKLWFNYTNAKGVIVSAFYEYSTRKFKSVVKGGQYGEGVAIRNLVAKPVIEGVLR